MVVQDHGSKAALQVTQDAGGVWVHLQGHRHMAPCARLWQACLVCHVANEHRGVGLMCHVANEHRGVGLVGQVANEYGGSA